MSRVVIVPGLAVRSYAVDPARALQARGHDVTLCRPPAWRGQASDLRRYGDELAAWLERDARPVDLLIGLSVGGQAAAITAARSDRVARLLLVSPTVDPPRRTRLVLIKAWLLEGGEHRDSPTMLDQAPDWVQAGLVRIYRGLVSALKVHLEDVLPEVSAPTTLVHADTDRLSPLEFAADLASSPTVRLVIMPDAPHSWPVGDDDRFCTFVEDLLIDQT